MWRTIRYYHRIFLEVLNLEMRGDGKKEFSLEKM